VYFRALAYLEPVSRHFSGGLFPQHKVCLQKGMRKMLKRLSICTGFVLGIVLFVTAPAKAQMGNSGSIEGVVKDPSGGVVAARRSKSRTP